MWLLCVDQQRETLTLVFLESKTEEDDDDNNNGRAFFEITDTTTNKKMKSYSRWG